MGQLLEGVKVCSFAWHLTGSLLNRLLADHGATVVKVESAVFVDLARFTGPFRGGISGWNRSLHFANYSCNTYGVGLNLKSPKGIELAKKLIAWSDIVTENFIPGTMEKRGLAYEDLVKINPDIIMISISNQGQKGPRSHHPGIGTGLQSLAGFTHLTGWPDRLPVGWYGAYTDYLSACMTTCALVGALDHRNKTGEGQFLEMSQYEVAEYLMSSVLLDYFCNNNVECRMGDRSEFAAPHGVYRCRGEERWCAIAAFDDSEWAALCKAMGNPAWCRRAEFATVLDRKKNEDALDGLINQWTVNFQAEDLMARLQAAGVPAGVVQNGRDLTADPQLEHRHYIWHLDHPEIGPHTCDTPAYTFSRTPSQGRSPAPLLGQHNEYVFGELLGIPSEEVATLIQEGVIEVP